MIAYEININMSANYKACLMKIIPIWNVNKLQQRKYLWDNNLWLLFITRMISHILTTVLKRPLILEFTPPSFRGTWSDESSHNDTS